MGVAENLQTRLFRKSPSSSITYRILSVDGTYPLLRTPRGPQQSTTKSNTPASRSIRFAAAPASTDPTQIPPFAFDPMQIPIDPDLGSTASGAVSRRQKRARSQVFPSPNGKREQTSGPKQRKQTTKRTKRAGTQNKQFNGIQHQAQPAPTRVPRPFFGLSLPLSPLGRCRRYFSAQM